MNADGYVVIGAKLDTKSFDAQIKEVEYELKQIDYELSKSKELKLDNRQIDEYKAKAEKLTNKLTTLKQKQDELNDKHTFENAKKNADDMRKKLTKWGLALFGIRSAYSFIRRSVSLLTQENEQLGSDIEYIRWALAQTLQPIIETIVKIVYNVLGVINSIAKAIFGVNLFANASADAFKKQKDNLKGANKEAKKLDKTLAGFDDLNILQKQDTSTTSTTSPTMDLSTAIDSGLVEGLMSTINNIFTFWETEWETFFGSFKGNWDAFFYGLGLTLKGFFDVLKSIGKLVIGVFDMIMGVLKGDKELIKKGFNILIEGITGLIKGLAEMIGGVILVVGGAVKGLFLDIWDFFYSIVVKPVIDTVNSMWTILVNGAKFAWDGIKSIFGGVASFFGKVFGDAWNGVKAIFSVGGKIFDGIKEGIVNAFSTIVNAIIGGVNKVVALPFNAINGVLNFIKDIDLPVIGKPFYGFWGYNPIYVPQIPKIPLRVGGIINRPNQGVPIGGESGREGVIPLTDIQAMEQLGEEIGKHIVLSATIPVYVGNRQVAREVRKIQKEEDYAFNR